MTTKPIIGDGSIHIHFGLSYANYMVLPRTLLQSMPEEWQEQFVRLLDEAEEAFAHVPQPASYDVRCRDERGRFIEDPVPYYWRGRARIERRSP